MGMIGEDLARHAEEIAERAQARGQDDLADWLRGWAGRSREMTDEEWQREVPRDDFAAVLVA